MGLREIQDLKSRANEPKPVKKYTIPKISKKRQKKLEEQKDLLKLDEAFYKEIWAASSHFCQNCGCKLPKTPYNWMFHHLLPKAKYPNFRHESINIAILCLLCHSKCETNIDFSPKIKSMIKIAEKELIK